MRIVATILICAASAIAHPNHHPAAETEALDRCREEVAASSAKAAAAPDNLALQASYGNACLKLARITTDHADFAKAEAALRKVYDADPFGEWTPYGLAYALVGQHRFAEALTFARRAAFQQPDEPETLALICDVHLSLGNTIESRAIAQRMADAELTLESLSRLSLAQHACGEMDEAVVSMQEALEAGGMLDAPPRSLAWCRSMLGDFAMERGDLDTARVEHEAALLLDPGCHHARWQLAKMDMRAGNAEDARDTMLSVVAAFPKPVYFVTLGDAHKALGGAEGERLATEAYKTAEGRMLAELGADGLGHIRELVEFWLSHAGDAGKAADLALRDLKEVRQDWGAFDTASWALYKAGRISEAVPLALEGQLRNSGDARSQCRAGIVLIAGGRKIEGRQLVSLALLRRDALEPALAAEGDGAMKSSAVSP